MSTPSLPQPENLRLQLARRLAVLALVAMALALALALLLRPQHNAFFTLQVFLSDLLLAAVAGLASRLTFRKQTWLLRFAAAGAVFLLGLALLGLFSGWRLGIDLLRGGRSRVDWVGLGQLSLGIGVIVLVLQAWQRPPAPKIEVPVLPVALPRTPALRAKRRPVRRPRRGTRTRVQAKPAAVIAETPLKPRRKRAVRRKPQLQFSAAEEHRCPYCLELVEPDDPRGVVECKICHTLHHADCWAITGTCQVPHYTA